MKKYIDLRYKFLPYLYNLFYQNCQDGTPVLRPLFHEFDHKKYYSLNDQFLVGPDILQAPAVTEADERDYILPEGKWYDLLKKEWISGGLKKRVKISFDYTPVYVRDGSVIPMLSGEEFQDSSSRDMRNTEFEAFFHNADMASLLFYEDDGETVAYRKGIKNLFEISLFRKKDRFSVAIKVLKNQYAFGLKEFRFNIHYRNKIIRISKTPE